MKMSIKSKLFVGFGLLLFLLIATAFFTLNRFSAANQRLTDLVDTSSKKVNLSYEIMTNALEIARWEKNLLLDKNARQYQIDSNNIQTALGQIEIHKLELYDLADANGKTILDEFQLNWDAYQIQLSEIMEASESDGENTIQLFLDSRENRDNAIQHLQDLAKKNKADIQAEKLASDQNFESSRNLIIILVIMGILITIGISVWIIRTIGKRISEIANKAERIASRQYTAEVVEDSIDDELSPIVDSLSSVNDSFREVAQNANLVASGEFSMDLEPRSEKDLLGVSLQKMTHSLRETTAANEKHNWLTSGQNQLNAKLMGNQDINELSDNIISFLAQFLNAILGALYLLDEQDHKLKLKGQFAFSSPEKTKQEFSLQEGLIGQAAREKRQFSLSELSEEHISVTSSIVKAKPTHVLILPFLFQNKVLGVLELGKLGTFSAREQEFLEGILESIGLSMHSAIARKQIQSLLTETQVQSEELQTQQEELRQMNEELEEQTQNLKQQQEELQMTNEELEEQTQSLETKNREVEAAKMDVEKKTKQLEISGRYKSEFLANMSHELRTPLNSLLILSKDLSENKAKNLFEEQVESAEIIYKSGQDLLALINEVLDLSRVEAGKMEIHPEKIFIREFIARLMRDFKHQAQKSGLKLEMHIESTVPEYLTSDAQRLNQILKNLLSNALKFTERGSVQLKVEREGTNNLKISVTDTGIGIKKEKQNAIFEAFQQADGGTARKYGGTGLGLSISRELAKLLGAKITLESKPNHGSTFSVLLPLELKTAASAFPDPSTDLLAQSPIKNSEYMNFPSIKDDRMHIGKDDKIVLIIEDDLQFANILLKQANQKGFKAITAATGEDGLELATEFMPHAIILDIDLPGINGHQVLAEIKNNPNIRHIPVHIVSVNERTLEAIREGAVEYLMKPVAKKDLEEAFNRIENFINRKMKTLLIIEDDQNSRTAIRKLIGNGDVKCLEAGTGKEALDIFEKNHIDCVVLDIGLPDISGFDLIYELEKMKEQIPPIIIYTGKELSKEENEELQNYADSIIIKGVKSEERLLDETALFLHRTISKLPESKQRIITNLYDKDAIFHQKKILVVDDDMRNVFALSKILKERNMTVIKAENGKIAMEILNKNPKMDLVLMDIMMPEMDGYEAMRKIRQQPQFRNLPIIALTAKAMKEDKQKCIDAGANDYIPKPLNVNRLLSLMQVWLSK